MTCEQRRDLLLLYVTNALDAEEAKEMRHHLLDGCPECAGYLAEATAVTMSIPFGLKPIVPPAHLKQKLMQRIAVDAETPAVAGATPMRLVKDDTAGSPSSFKLFRYLIPTAVAAGLAIALTHSYMMGEVDTLKNRLDAQSSQRSSEILQLQNQYQSQTQVVEMLRSPDLRVIPLKHSEYQPNAVANLLWDQKRQQWALLATGMSPAAAGQTYELWFITKAGPTRAGTFDVDSKGVGSLLVNIPPGLGTIVTAAVTNEKAGGADSPTGHFQVLSNID